MGETENTGVLYLDGKPLRLTEMPEITFDSSIDGKDIIGAFSCDRSCSFTATFRYSKMSRKRFVRNLMKQGYSKRLQNGYRGTAIKRESHIAKPIR